MLKTGTKISVPTLENKNGRVKHLCFPPKTQNRPVWCLGVFCKIRSVQTFSQAHLSHSSVTTRSRNGNACCPRHRSTASHLMHAGGVAPCLSKHASLFQLLHFSQLILKSVSPSLSLSLSLSINRVRETTTRTSSVVGGVRTYDTPPVLSQPYLEQRGLVSSTVCFIVSPKKQCAHE